MGMMHSEVANLFAVVQRLRKEAKEYVEKIQFFETENNILASRHREGNQLLEFYRKKLEEGRIRAEKYRKELEYWRKRFLKETTVWEEMKVQEKDKNDIERWFLEHDNLLHWGAEDGLTYIIKGTMNPNWDEN
jgi:hypothetical protein